ncbi:deoxynucleoside triphosphate triphosphohydrolase SAMHD1-like isoform X2 [Etheostoma cragini]|uniref:deoxynucleoside triphosphate triphosphohydrolase SAMHD1-like isoform X2 n=1 Tax=Etheostoma cragini TaxID=417921 RepID=UPI00155EB903|nr:deoxynucleoside triphosphate triphosphohydrolase SAMHD1-like isoform X2 [Etheostoma cragini]
MSDSSTPPQKKLKMDDKVFNDPIHGTVILHPLLIKIIDTPQFQRLRNIKQLGGAYFVYPGASHNRFEHSIGVAHLAGQLVEALRARQPELNIDDRDVLCVKIAGLCHDLGHGPFSHLYDQMFIPKVPHPPGELGDKMAKWKHEDASVKMFDHLVESISLLKKLEDEDKVFIREMINGPEGQEDPNAVKWPYKGRKEDKSFLYEIVANKLNGIDVDKFDYIARDCHHLGMKNNFDHLRFIQYARVCKVEGLNHICSRDKEVNNLYDMFYTRNCLHRRAYQHRVNKIIEYMIAEAFLKADKHIQIEGSEGQKYTLSKAKGDMEAYTKLTDHVFDQILNSSSAKLDEAKKILERIISRDHYKFLGETNPEQFPTGESHLQWEEELAAAVPEGGDGGVTLTREDFVVLVATFDYGKKEEDPINNVFFYSKRNPDKGFKITRDQVSRILPECFSEKLIRVYSRKTDEQSVEAARRHFSKWCARRGFPEPQNGDTATPEVIPGDNI